MKWIYRDAPGYLTAFFLLMLLAIPLSAETATFNSDTDFAQVEKVRMIYRGNGRWDINVTVRHNDQGWDHYADRWQILDDASEEILGERILAHPHDTEQPFTRGLSGFVIPENSRILRFRSSCPNHGFGGRETLVTLPSGSIENGFTLNF